MHEHGINKSMRYIVTIKKEHPRQDGYPDGTVYDVSTSQLETKWREMGVDRPFEVTLQDLLDEVGEMAVGCDGMADV